LKTYCINNQAKYEALLFGLELLDYMGVRHVRAFGDSQLVVLQILEEYQCLDGTLNSYLKKCWDIIRSFDEFDTRHIFRANNLVQDASGYRIKRGRFHNAENLITGVVLIPRSRIAQATYLDRSRWAQIVQARSLDRSTVPETSPLLIRLPTQLMLLIGGHI
jgi:ribonuclease HI